MVAILMMPAKLATLGPLKIKLFQNKGSDAIFFPCVTNETLSCDSNYIVDVVVIINSILYGFDQKKQFFFNLVQVQ